MRSEFHRKNAKMLRLVIELSESEATTEVARHAKQQDHLLRRRMSQICSDDDSDVTGGGSNSYDDAPRPTTPTQGGYNRTVDRKGKGWRGNGDVLHPSPIYLCF